MGRVEPSGDGWNLSSSVCCKDWIDDENQDETFTKKTG